jgi:hypothetical protein
MPQFKKTIGTVGRPREESKVLMVEKYYYITLQEEELGVPRRKRKCGYRSG